MANTTFLSAGWDETQDGSFYAGLNTGTGSTATYDSTQAHAGTGSLKCVVTQSGQYASPYTPDNTVADAGGCISAWFRFSTVSPATLTNFLMMLTSGNGSGRMGLGLNTNGTINFAQRGATQANGSTTLSANTWYRISLSYTNASVSTWAAKVYINGTLEINASAGVQGNASSTGVVCVSFGQNSSSFGSFSTPAVSTIWIDSMYIDNRTNLTDCGAIDVTAKRPFSNGTTNGFTTQIGAGGSGYGTGHAPQVNERPLSTTNGWSMVGAGSAVTEEYTLEGASVGDVDISAATIKDFMGWVDVKALIAETGSIIVGGVSSSISVTTSAAIFTQAAGSATYPTGGTAIGVITSTTVTTFSLYECGIVVAYTPAMNPVGKLLTVQQAMNRAGTY